MEIFQKKSQKSLGFRHSQKLDKHALLEKLTIIKKQTHLVKKIHTTSGIITRELYMHVPIKKCLLLSHRLYMYLSDAE